MPPLDESIDKERREERSDYMPGGIPSDQKKLLGYALELISICRASAGVRAAYCRQLYALSETGKQDGTRSLINVLFSQLDRLASHLFSPIDLRFTMSSENDYPQAILKQAQQASRLLTRDWENTNTDVLFALGVFESLRYGACMLKQWAQQEGHDRRPAYYSSLVMPWQFGVFREDQNDLSRQPAMCETTYLSLPEVWRRIYHLPDAERLYMRIKANAQRGSDGDDTTSFFHQVLSTATLNTSGTQGGRPMPGGVVNLVNDPSYALLGPQIEADLIKMHELWVWGETDYVTIQVIEPDIIVAPRYGFKPSNILVEGCNPYTLIQPNMTQGYFWGRSELVDLIRPQEWLSVSADDAQRLIGLQVDKLLAFAGYDGLTDELYDQTRAAGYFPMPQGASVSDMTPKFPEQLLPIIQMIMEIIDKMGGFDNLLSGRGEPGVRAGVHADTLMKTASPRLRDRALLLERQCASAGGLRFSIMQAKDGRNYWTDGTTEEKMAETSFTLHDIPDDMSVTVDSHSGSPIFMDDHQQLIAFGIKAGFIDGESALEMLPYPEKGLLIQRLKMKQAEQAALLKQLAERDPQGLEKVLTHQKGGHK